MTAFLAWIDFDQADPGSHAAHYGPVRGRGHAGRAWDRLHSRRFVRPDVPGNQHNPDAPALHAFRAVDLPDGGSASGQHRRRILQ